MSNHKPFCPCDFGWVREPTGGCGRPTQPTTVQTTTISTTTHTTTSITTTTELATTATTKPPGWCGSDSKCEWAEACIDHFCQNVCTPSTCTHSHEACAVANHKAFCLCDSGWVREPAGDCARPTQPTTMPTTTTTTTTPTTASITTTTELVTTATTKPPGWCDKDSKCKWAEACVDHFCQNVCVPAPCTHPHEVCTVSWLTKHKAVCYCDSGWIREPTGECGRPTEPTTISTTTSTTTKKTTAPTKPPGWCDWDSDCNWDEVCQNHICKCMNGWVREPTGACFPISTK